MTPSGAIATAAPTVTAPASTARQYTLGQADVAVEVGEGVVEPLELRGTVAAPAGTGPHPVVLVLHGSHAVCPMQSRSVPPGATVGVGVDVFAADGFSRLASSAGNIPVNLAAGEAVVQLAPASS